MRRGTSAWRERFWMSCALVPLKVIDFAPGVRLAVDQRAEPAFVELARVMKSHGYQVRPNVTGSFNCRKVTGGNYLSSHSYGIAVDINADTNPYMTGRKRKLITDMSDAMIRDIYAIKTVKGNQVWRWGGDWDGNPATSHSNYDAMHFEIIVSPDELAAGIRESVEMDMEDSKTWPILKRGSRGGSVAFLQRWFGLHDDGIFGAATEAKVRWYQKMQGLVEDGVVGPATWTFMLHGMLPARERKNLPAPNKGMTGGLSYEPANGAVHG